MKIILYFILYIGFTNILYAPARMHTNTIIYPTGHKYETKQKYEICRFKYVIYNLKYGIKFQTFKN